MGSNNGQGNRSLISGTWGKCEALWTAPVLLLVESSPQASPVSGKGVFTARDGGIAELTSSRTSSELNVSFLLRKVRKGTEEMYEVLLESGREMV